MSDGRTTDRPAEPKPPLPPIPVRPIAFEASTGPDWGRRFAWALVTVALAWTVLMIGPARPLGSARGLRGLSALALAASVPFIVFLYAAFRRHGVEPPDDPRPKSERDED